MREPRDAWVRALRDLTGVEADDIRWNVALGRWEFVMAGADGIPRSQFWGDFRRPLDPVTGMYPFRELDDDGMREALANLERTFVGNVYDGAGTTRREVMRRYRFNEAHRQDGYRRAGEAFADMAAERGRRLRGGALIHVPVTIGGGSAAT